MSLLRLTAIGAPLLLGLAVLIFTLGFERKTTLSFLTPYRHWWQNNLRLFKVPAFINLGPEIQLAVVATTVLIGAATGDLIFIGVALLFAVIPPFLLHRSVRLRHDLLESQVDGMLTALANALGATPNLGDAVASLMDFTEEPMKGELAAVLGEVRLGRTLDEALEALSKRAKIYGIESAVTALVTGKRTGGDLPHILNQTAKAIRESTRLAGVLKTKTAEGRNQAVVLGLVPPLLIVALQKIDPGWLAPMWSEPLGWVLLGAAALLEITALALVKKIMAVDL